MKSPHKLFQVEMKNNVPLEITAISPVRGGFPQTTFQDYVSVSFNLRPSSVGGLEIRSSIKLGGESVSLLAEKGRMQSRKWFKMKRKLLSRTLMC